MTVHGGSSSYAAALGDIAIQRCEVGGCRCDLAIVEGRVHSEAVQRVSGVLQSQPQQGNSIANLNPIEPRRAGQEDSIGVQTQAALAELLRRWLEEQRLQQVQAAATSEASANAEIARLRAEMDVLRKQPAEARQPAASAAVNEAHALVIGNSAYAGSNRLANPVNDARAMSAKLRSLGFKVTEIPNASREQLVRGLSDFSRTAARADLTLLFYAGHGVQIAGVNYMVPVDMNLADPAQAALQAVSLNSVVEQYLPGKTKLVFLDACRDNPLMASVGRGITKGLAPINVSEGTLIAYATKDGQVAEDGAGQSNSPFTSALLEHLADPDDIAVVLRTVRAKVMQRTNNRQQPWEYGSLTGGALVLSAIRR